MLHPTIVYDCWIMIQQGLPGWWFQPQQKIVVNWDDDIPNIWKNKPVMFQSPPTSYQSPLITINPNKHHYY